MKRNINTLVHVLLKSWRFVRWDKFVPEPLNYTQMNKHGDTLCDDFITLDTETSWNHNEAQPVGWVYQWALTYCGAVVYGRRPSELMTVLERIKRVNNIGEYAVSESGSVCHKISVYVHNLSYDYAYIGDWLRLTFGGVYKSGEDTQRMLAISPHSILTYESAGFCFKCSYKLTHKSLAQWGKEMNTKHRKLVGTVDYDAIHYQDSKLTFTDWKYMFYDVIVLDECLRMQMRLYNDDLISIPLTVTGYVRRECRNEYLKDKKNRYKFLDRRLDIDLYNMCRDEFAGGFTHGNRFLSGKTVRGTIKHRDFRSHYPSQQRAHLFPVGKPYIYFDAFKSRQRGTKPPTIERIMEIAKGRCVLVKMRISFAELKDYNITMPFLQYDKCIKGYGNRKGVGAVAESAIDDNGRVIKIGSRTDEIYFTICVNEDDLKILLYMYNIRYVIEKVVIIPRGKLPQYLIDSIDKFFKGKTDYKDQVKELEKMKAKDTDPRLIEAINNLMIAKGLLNGIYGMSATDPIRYSFIEDYESGEWTKETKTDEEQKEALQKYYADFTHFMDYQFGLWTTSHARYELFQFCRLVGWENVLYCDTDSIFYISTPEIEKRIEAKNQQLKEHAEKVGAYITSNKGKIVHYDQFELEKEDIVAFRFLHAKCYAYERIVYRKDGKPLLDNQGNKQTELICVIAGVPKFGKDENGKTITREQELESIDNLYEGRVFTRCGGRTKKYIPAKPHTEIINGHEIECASSCILMDTTKTLKGMDEVLSEHNNYAEVYQEFDCEY